MSPRTRLVSRAWYGIRHLTTPLRSIHLPVESPRKVGAPESSLQLTRPHGWHSGALGSPSPVRGQRRHRRPHRRRARGGSDGESGIWVSAGHQQMDTEPCKQASLQLRLNDETPVFPTVLYLSLAHKAIGTNHNNVPRL